MVVDESLVLDAGGLTSGLSLPAQKSLKAVLLTHQHYDHIRDILALGVNLFHSGASIDIYTTSQVIEIVTTHFLTSGIYRNLAEMPEENPTFRFNTIESLKPFKAAGYDVIAVPVKHSVFTVGFQVTSPDGKVMFYTGDTGPGLSECWEQVTPQMLIIECTESNESTESCKKVGHLTPGLLKQELLAFREMKGYLPEVVTVHMSPSLEEEIQGEISALSGELDCRITLGYEGMELNL